MQRNPATHYPEAVAQRPPVALVTFYHDIEQNLDSDADPECCRQVVKAFLDLERRYGVCATYNVAGKLVREQADLVDWITADGHEVAFHSYDHPPDWSPCHYSTQIDRCREVSAAICGYRSPRSEIDAAAVHHLWETGFRWNAEADRRGEPYFIYKGLVRLPIAADDWPLHRGSVNAEEYLLRFTHLLRQRRYVAIGFHDSATSRAPHERLALWEELLKAASQAHSSTITFSEAADLFRRAAVARYYTRTAEEWHRGTQSLYRTRRFRELVQSEMRTLTSPVVADLGSGGGVLSAPLRDRAKTVYCVDNAPGMLAAVDASGCIQPRLGEVTATDLPDRSVDLIICARIIEYLSWPDRLADEIRRIGKVGATYLVTFPAAGDVPPSNDGSPPDRVRRHFTPEDIRRWAEPIGPGRLIGIQYERPEPTDLASEQRYRLIEESPPPSATPTNWVYIGIVEDRGVVRRHARTLGVSAARFRFPTDRAERIEALLRQAAGWLPPAVRKLGARLIAHTRS
jgi:peptidoglycan/xylan/chitin deacetylase (PgdA/CDA1 family)/SAM-dependent methyltransferase